MNLSYEDAMDWLGLGHCGRPDIEILGYDDTVVPAFIRLDLGEPREGRFSRLSDRPDD